MNTLETKKGNKKTAVYFSLLAIILIVGTVGCKKKIEPKAVEVQVTPTDTLTDSIATDSTNFQYEYEVNNVNSHTSSAPVVASDLNANHKYFVVLGSFESHQLAEAYVKQLAEKELSAIIVQRERGLNMEFNRVSIFSSNDLNTTLRMCEKLKSDYPEAWVLIK
ncbi:MAG: SPOR domain-containing protein [Mangrovibacterium sp.]